MNIRRHAISIGFGVALIGVIGAYAARKHLYQYQWDIEKLPPGASYSLTKWLGHEVSTACVILPYSTQTLEKSPETAPIDEFLKQSGYVGLEAEWSIALTSVGQTMIYKFDRGQKSDVLASSALTANEAAVLPRNFAATDCVSGSGASIAKIRRGEREFVIVGRQP